MPGDFRDALSVLFHGPKFPETDLEAWALDLFEQEWVKALHLFTPIFRV